MAEADRHLWEYRWFQDVGLLLGLLAVLWFLYSVQAIAVPVLIGFALAYAVNPAATWAKRRLRVPRLLTAVLLLAAGLALVGLLLFCFLPSLVSQAQLLAGSLGKYVAWLTERGQEQWQEFLRRTAAVVAPGTEAGGTAAGPAATTHPTAMGLGLDLATLGSLLRRSLGIGVGVVGTALGMGSYLALALAIVLFCFVVFVWHFQRIVDWFAQFIPVASREHAFRIARRIDRALSGFIRGRLIQAAILTVNLAIGWKLAAVPFWLLLAAVAGVLNLVPYAAIFGFLLAAGLTVVDRLMAGGAAATGFPWEALLWPTVAYVLAQLVDGWVVEPLVQGKATDLNSLTILLAVVTGASVAGLLGMLLAIPVTACLKILAEELLLPRLRAYAHRESPPSSS